MLFDFRTKQLGAMLAGAWAVAAWSPALADSTPQPAPSAAPVPAQHPQPADKVQVSGRNDLRQRSTASKIVVGREEILSFGDHSMAEVLNRLPGISLSGEPGRNREVRMRGLGGGYTQILVNGDPAPAGFSLDTLAPDLVERIEVLRAATAEHGARAIAGTINIVLKSVVRKTEREIKAGISREGRRYSPHLAAQLADRAGALSYLVALTAAQNRSLRTSEVEDEVFSRSGQLLARSVTGRERNTRADTFNLSPRLTWRLDDDSQLVVRAYLDHYRDFLIGQDRSRIESGQPLDYLGNALRQGTLLQTLRSDLAWNTVFANDSKLDLKLGGTLHRRDIDGQRLADGLDGRPALDRQVRSKADDKSISTGGKYTVPLAEQHGLGLGWELEASQRKERREQIDLESPDLYDPQRPTLRTASGERYTSRVRRTALYLQDEWDITPAWSTYLGVRWEEIRTRSISDFSPAIRHRSQVWSPSLQVLWRVSGQAKDQLRFAVSRTYKAPTTGNLMNIRALSLNNSPTATDNQGNPDLRPELAWGADLAYEHYFGKTGFISASLFARQIDDVIGSQLYHDQGRWVTLPVNIGKADVYGVELESKFQLKDLIQTQTELEIKANLSRNWSWLRSIPGPDNRLDRQVPLTANLGLDYRFAKLPWRVGGNFNFQASSHNRLSSSQTVVVSARRALDLFALWQIDPKTRLRLSLSNLLHPTSRVAVEYADEAGSSRQTTDQRSRAIGRVMFEIKL
ncbi:TonB-dependent receptor plug domain-containing protein [Chitinimonas lacunae]|uniref:TonB-dependent receptor plug domain-containing protein n=1 Tax=Chitinimonas lacunae TaxID=1963018 RepID=A0ABV8MQK7_9NEIS